MVIQIGVHPTGEKPDQHIVRAAPGASRTTTIHKVPTKSKSDSCSRDEVLTSSDARPGRHPGLPHSPSNKLPQSREVWFNKVVTRLLGLQDSIKPDMRSVQIKACHQGQQPSSTRAGCKGAWDTDRQVQLQSMHSRWLASG
jgi:hypothetical protein